MSIDAEVGGRWGERGPDGTDRPYGTVTVWDPPRRVGLTWAVAEGRSGIDVTVADVHDDLTTVIVEQRGLDHLDPDERAWLTGDDGWWATLRAFAAAARAARAA